MCQIGYNVFAFCSILAAANHRVHTEAISAQSATLLIPASSLPHEQKEQDCWETSHWKDHSHSATCASQLTDARCRQGMALLSPPLYGDYGCHTTCTISKDRLQWDNVLMACQVCISQHLPMPSPLHGLYTLLPRAFLLAWPTPSCHNGCRRPFRHTPMASYVILVSSLRQHAQKMDGVTSTLRTAPVLPLAHTQLRAMVVMLS